MRTLLLVSSAALALAGCATSAPDGPGRSAVVVVVSSDGRETVLRAARVAGDSLVGLSPVGDRTAIATAQIERIEARRAPVAPSTPGAHPVGVAAVTAAGVAFAAVLFSALSK